MGSTLTDVVIEAPTVRVEVSDEASTHLPSMFVSMSGMIGGGWTDTLTGCTVNGGIIRLDARQPVCLTAEKST